MAIETIEIDFRRVSEVLLDDGYWHPVSQVLYRNIRGKVPFKDGVVIRSGGDYIYCPTSSIRAFKGDYVPTEEELAEQREERQQAAERLFRWQHYTTADVYSTAVEAQGGLCPKCRSQLKDYPITHWVESEGAVLCRACSPLRPRFGEPSGQF
jgi:hypothetical protein